ncbi:hypothetical protein NMG60_11003990 [Bertholletia excelsa]
MLSMPWSPFNMEEEGSERKNRFSTASANPHNTTSSVDVGLRILIQLSQGKSNFVVKPSLKLKKPIFWTNRTVDLPSYYDSSSFLKYCYLCNKYLSPDKDVFMYRGDQGFCSAECRSRQIYLNEMKEIEESRKRMAATFRECRQRERCETRALLEEFRRRHRPLSSCQKGRAIAL